MPAISDPATPTDRLFTAPDRKLLLLLFLIGPLPAVAYFLHHGSTSFQQTLTPEGVLWACGRGLRHPHEIVTPLFDFLAGVTHTLSCGDLGPLSRIGPEGLFAKLQPYFTWSSALLWRAFGVHYVALLPLVFLMYAGYATGAYALARLFLGRGLAVLAALICAWAPLAVGMSIFIRDFSKAPFFVWSIALTILAIRSTDLRRSLLLATASATVVGVGYGFRSDLLALLPIGAAVLAVGVGPASGVPRRVLPVARLIVAAGYILAATVVSAPVRTQIDVGQVGGTFALQGATEPFRIATGLRPAAYTLGWAYSDELTLSGVAAAERRLDPSWDAEELAHTPVLEMSGALAKSSAHLLGWADVFVADFFAQAIKSAGWVLGLPAFVARSGPIPQLATAPDLQSYNPARAVLYAYGMLGHAWFVWVGVLATLAWLYRVYLRSPREALWLFTLLAFLVSYPSIQFAPRHVFHLEAVWVIATLNLLSSWAWLPGSMAAARGFLGYALGIAGLVLFAYLGAVQYERVTLTRELDRLLALPRERVSCSVARQGNGERFLEVPVPPAYAALVHGKRDSLVLESRFVGVRWDVRAAADRLLVTFSGASCPLAKVRLVAHYRHTDLTWQPLDAELSLVATPRAGSLSMLLPAFYRGTQSFAGLVIPKDLDACTVNIERIIGGSRLPLVFTADLQGQALLGPAHKRLGSYSIHADGAAVTRQAN
jgi:hypothetical protein